jgi:hypothetical protein
MQRLLTLKRLGSVYGLIEEMHSLEARLAAANVGEVESTIRREVATLDAAWKTERLALPNQDLIGRSAMMARKEVAVRKNRQLAPILEQRCEIRELAQIRYKDSRIWSERMKSLVEAELSKIDTVEEHRQQAVSDDRFLAQKQRKKTRTGRPSR